MRMKIIFVILAALLILPIATATSYFVSLENNQGSFTLKKIQLAESSSANEFSGGEYSVRILSYKKAVLYETSFNAKRQGAYSMPLDAQSAKETIVPELKSINIVLPYFANAEKILVMKEGKTLLEIDAGQFATCNENKICEGKESLETCKSDCTCGNGICEENYNTCSKDCSSGTGDGYCDKANDGKCDPDCNTQNDADCKGAANQFITYIIGAGVFAVACVLLLLLKSRKTSQPDKKKK